MEILKILCILILNYVALDAFERVARSANCPRFVQNDFPSLKPIKYRRKGTKAQFRCRKKFILYGQKFAICQSDGTWSNDPPLCTKTGCVPLDPSQVTNLDMDVVNGAVVKFSCLENYLLIGDTQAHCDGKDWSAPLPRCAAPHELTECDFEDDLCGWTQDDNEEQDWQRNVGATQTGNTGPKHDHTLGDTGNGHYLYFETSNPTMTGHQASLLSPMYTEDLSPMCFDFWYHILGPDEKGHVGSLEVFVLDQSQYIDDDDVHPLFYIDGNQGDQWHRGNIFIDKQDEPFQIAIVATRALSYISDIAIDDVRLHNCTKSTTFSPVSTTLLFSPTATKSSVSSTQSTVITQRTETISPTTIKTETTVTTETPTGTKYKKETTESTTPPNVNTGTPATTMSVNTTSEATTVIQVSSTPNVKTDSSTKVESTSKVTMEQKTSPNTPSPFTLTTVKMTSKAYPFTNTMTSKKTTTHTTEKQKTYRPSSGTQQPSTLYSTTIINTTSSARSTTDSPTTVKFETSTSMLMNTSTFRPSQKQTTTTTKTSSMVSSETSTKSPKSSTIFTTKENFSSTTTSATTSRSSSTSTTFSSSRSSTSTATSSSSRTTSSSSSSFSTSSSSRSTTYTSSSTISPDVKTTDESKQSTTKNSDITQSKDVTDSNTKSIVTDTSSNPDKSVKTTKRTNMITTKSTKKSNNGTKDNSITVSEGRSQHPEDDTLKPLMIGLCVGIVAGLIIIGVIAYVCVRRRKFYTSRHEDELKPITNSASLQSLNNGHYYQDEEYESES